MARENDLFLLDGNSLAYRAFFALPETMATSDGRPSNAIFGFASMLAKLVTDYQPAGLVVAWDAGMSGRDEVYPEYKAQRPPRPDLLSEQWPALPALVDAFGFSNVRVDGYEADDVLASLCERAKAEGIPVVVVSGDRDVYQLVTDGVRVMSTGRGVTDVKLYDRETVVERWGVPPELVTDLIGLKGDSSDNIPGVPGIGEKTAAALLAEFGSLEEVLASTEKVSGAKRKQNLQAHAEDARVSKRLATVDRDVEMEIDLGQLIGFEPDEVALREYMREYELRAVMDRLEAMLPDQVSSAAEHPEEIAFRHAALGELPEGPLAVAIHDASWAATPGADAELLVGSGSIEEIALCLSGHPLLGHDLKSLGGGRHGLLAASYQQAERQTLLHDTMIAGYLLEPGRRGYALTELATSAGLQVQGAHDEAAQLSLEETEAASDSEIASEARLVASVAEHQRQRLEEDGLVRLFTEVELPLVEVLAAMERRGLKLDTERLGEIRAELAGRLEELERTVHELAGREFAVGSPQQVAEVLFEELGLTRKRRGKTGYSTDARVLSQIRDEHPIVTEIENWREISKLLSTYLDTLPELVDPETGRIHTTFNQTTAATGRLSSTAPNLQNIPIRTEIGRPIRGCFVPEPGHAITSADYSQVELRVLAHVADEPVLKDVFRAGDDVHAATAAEVFGVERENVDAGMRSKAKMVNFGIIYGLTGFGLADRLNIPRAEGDEFVARYLDRFPAVREFRERTIAEARENGFVCTVLGRRRSLPELRSDRAQTRQLGERLAVNTVVQGSAADIIKLAMIGCERAVTEAGLSTILVLQIHDELLFEGPTDEVSKAETIIRREMVSAFDLDPSLEVEIGSGPDWLQAK